MKALFRHKASAKSYRLAHVGLGMTVFVGLWSLYRDRTHLLLREIPGRPEDYKQNVKNETSA